MDVGSTLFLHLFYNISIFFVKYILPRQTILISTYKNRQETFYKPLQNLTLHFLSTHLPHFELCLCQHSIS